MENDEAAYVDQAEDTIRTADFVLQCVGVLGNTLLLVVFVATPRQRTVPDMFLLQRAVAQMLDFVALAGWNVLPSSELKVMGVLCSIVAVAVHVAWVGNVMFFLLFTADGYLGSRPQRYTLSNRRKVMRLTSVGVWLLAAALGFTSYLFAYILEAPEPVCVYTLLLDASIFLRILIRAFFEAGVPLVVGWVFVGLALDKASLEEGQEGPNRRLLLSLAATFSVTHGVSWVMVILILVSTIRIIPAIVVLVLFPSVERIISPILVICLSEALRLKVAGWFANCSPRRSGSLPLRGAVSCRAREHSTVLEVHQGWLPSPPARPPRSPSTWRATGP